MTSVTEEAYIKILQHWIKVKHHYAIPVWLGKSFLTGPAESRPWSFKIGSVSLLPPSSQLDASCPSFLIKACSSASRSIKAFRNRQLFDLTSRSFCSSSHADESRRSAFDMGRRVARPRLSMTPLGFLFSSMICKLLSWAIKLNSWIIYFSPSAQRREWVSLSCKRWWRLRWEWRRRLSDPREPGRWQLPSRT